MTEGRTPSPVEVIASELCNPETHQADRLAKIIVNALTDAGYEITSASTPTPNAEHEEFRQALVEALEITYGLPEQGNRLRYPEDEEIILWVRSERRRVMTMHRGHHAEILNGHTCPDCGIYGGPSARTER